MSDLNFKSTEQEINGSNKPMDLDIDYTSKNVAHSKWSVKKVARYLMVLVVKLDIGGGGSSQKDDKILLS